MNESPKYYWNIDRIMWLLIGIAMAVGLFFLLGYLRNALLPFFVACAVAYILQPLVALNQKITHIKGRVIPSILTIIEVTAVFVLLVWLVTPSVVKDLQSFQNIIHGIAEGKIDVPEGYKPILAFFNKYFDIDYFLKFASSIKLETLLNKGTMLLQQSAEVVIHTVEWLLTLIYVLFILIDYPQIVRGFKLIFPLKYRDRAMKVVMDVRNNMNHYFRGQGKVAMFAVVFYCIGFLIVGLPLAVPMGLLVGILYMIPYFQYITLIPVTIICFIYSLSGQAELLPLLGACGLVYVVSQCLCDYVVTPHVMGKELGLNPAIILLALSVWGSLLGIIGMIIALPMTALLMTYYETYISNRK